MQLAPYEGGLIALAGEGSAVVIEQFINKAQHLWALCYIPAPLHDAKSLLLEIAECYKIRLSENDEISEIIVKLREFFRLSYQDSQHSIIVLGSTEKLSQESISALRQLMDGATKSDFCIILTSLHSVAALKQITPYTSRIFDVAMPEVTPVISGRSSSTNRPWLKIGSLTLIGVLGAIVGFFLLNKPTPAPLSKSPPPLVALPSPPLQSTLPPVPQAEPLPESTTIPEDPTPSEITVIPTPPGPIHMEPTPDVSPQQTLEKKRIQNADWLLAQPPSHYTIQIIALKNEKKVEQVSKLFQDKETVLARYPLLRRGVVLNALVYGVYEQLEQAQHIAADPSLSVDGIKPWVRRLDEIHADIEKAKQAAASEN